MGHALLERIFQTLGQPDHQGKGLGWASELATDPEEVAKVRAFDEFHDHEILLIALAVFVDPDDVGMDEPEPDSAS